MAGLPTVASRHNTPSRAHALTKMVLAEKKGGDSVAIIVRKKRDRERERERGREKERERERERERTNEGPEGERYTLYKKITSREHLL